MKTSIKLFALGMILMGFSATSFAQVNATATAAATIVTPISISKTIDMNFGNVAVSGTNLGTVVLLPAGTRTATGGVTLPITNGTVTAASFTVGGFANSTYTITLPTSVTLNSGTNTMTADTFTSDPATTGALVGGTQILNVGATLKVAAAQAPGAYLSSTPFTVTVNYN
jgi:hypothetical protein